VLALDGSIVTMTSFLLTFFLPCRQQFAVNHSLEEQQRVFAFQTGLTQGMILQEEVEQWGARVKVMTKSFR